MMNRKILFIFFFSILSVTAFGQYRLYENGLEEYQNQRYEKAIELFNEYFTKSARDKKIDIEVYYYRGLSYFKSHNYKSAITDFQECIILDHPNKGNIHWFVAKCHEKSNQHEQAINEFTKAIAILKSDKSAHSKLLFERSQSYSKLNNPASAFDDITVASTLNPDDQSIKEELDRLGKLTRGKNESKTQGEKTLAKTDPPKQNEQRNQPQNAETKKEEPVVAKTEVKEEPKQTVPQVVVPPAVVDKYAGEKRYALVIGNSNYPKEIGALRNPVNDATDVAKELRNSQFDVDLLTNATYIQMREAMRKFHEKLSAGPKDQTVGLFYFAGHGVQHEDENYLVPLDAVVEFEDDIARMCFPVQRIVLANMERSNSRMNIVILDACRNNPFPAATRSVTQGLGEMKRARGSFIAYATAPGSIASDGSGRNGLYTQELLKSMRKPGLTIEQVFKEVRASVLRLSGDRQNTWDSSNIIGDFYFKLN